MLRLKRPTRLAAQALIAAAVILGPAGPAAAQDAGTLPSVTVLGFELLDDHPDPSQAATLARRLAEADRQLREGLQERHLYRVAGPEAGRETIERLRAQHAYLYSCAGCAQEIGRAAHTDLVLAGWVQKVSELILNVNVELRDVATDRVVLRKSVDMRGNNDESWMRAVRFMLRDWSERRQANPNYGR